ADIRIDTLKDRQRLGASRQGSPMLIPSREMTIQRAELTLFGNQEQRQMARLDAALAVADQHSQPDLINQRMQGWKIVLTKSGRRVHSELLRCRGHGHGAMQKSVTYCRWSRLAQLGRMQLVNPPLKSGNTKCNVCSAFSWRCVSA